MKIYLPLSLSLVGVFQLKRAQSYAAEKTGTNDLTAAVPYSIQRRRSFPNLIRVATQSAHSNRKTYHPTIQFSADEILGWWCDCPIGCRIIGCCSHVSSVIWFLSYRRCDFSNARRTSTDPVNFIRDSIPISDFYDSSDDEATTTDRYSLTWANFFSIVYDVSVNKCAFKQTKSLAPSKSKVFGDLCSRRVSCPPEGVLASLAKL